MSMESFLKAQREAEARRTAIEKEGKDGPTAKAIADATAKDEAQRKASSFPEPQKTESQASESTKPAPTKKQPPGAGFGNIGGGGETSTAPPPRPTEEPKAAKPPKTIKIDEGDGQTSTVKVSSEPANRPAPPKPTKEEVAAAELALDKAAAEREVAKLELEARTDAKAKDLAVKSFEKRAEKLSSEVSEQADRLNTRAAQLDQERARLDAQRAQLAANPSDRAAVDAYNKSLAEFQKSIDSYSTDRDKLISRSDEVSAQLETASASLNDRLGAIDEKAHERHQQAVRGVEAINQRVSEFNTQQAEQFRIARDIAKSQVSEAQSILADQQSAARFWSDKQREEFEKRAAELSKLTAQIERGKTADMVQEKEDFKAAQRELDMLQREILAFERSRPATAQPTDAGTVISPDQRRTAISVVGNALKSLSRQLGSTSETPRTGSVRDPSTLMAAPGAGELGTQAVKGFGKAVELGDKLSARLSVPVAVPGGPRLEGMERGQITRIVPAETIDEAGERAVQWLRENQNERAALVVDVLRPRGLVSATLWVTAAGEAALISRAGGRMVIRGIGNTPAAARKAEQAVRAAIDAATPPGGAAGQRGVVGAGTRRAPMPVKEGINPVAAFETLQSSRTATGSRAAVDALNAARQRADMQQVSSSAARIAGEQRPLVAPRTAGQMGAASPTRLTALELRQQVAMQAQQLRRANPKLTRTQAQRQAEAQVQRQVAAQRLQAQPDVSFQVGTIQLPGAASPGMTPAVQPEQVSDRVTKIRKDVQTVPQPVSVPGAIPVPGAPPKQDPGLVEVGDSPSPSPPPAASPSPSPTPSPPPKTPPVDQPDPPPVVTPDPPLAEDPVITPDPLPDPDPGVPPPDRPPGLPPPGQPPRTPPPGEPPSSPPPQPPPGRPSGTPRLPRLPSGGMGRVLPVAEQQNYVEEIQWKQGKSFVAFNFQTGKKEQNTFPKPGGVNPGTKPIETLKIIDTDPNKPKITKTKVGAFRVDASKAGQLIFKKLPNVKKREPKGDGFGGGGFSGSFNAFGGGGGERVFKEDQAERSTKKPKPPERGFAT